MSAASKANAQKSTGPVTAAGKAKSSRNSITHGLTSETPVLPHESQKDYDELQGEFYKQYKPVTDMEFELLFRMVDCWWKTKRAQRVENEFLSKRAGDTGIADMLDEPKETAKFRLLMRYMAAAERSWRNALADFLAAIKLRKQQITDQAAEFEACLNAPMPELPPIALPLPDSFVSHKPEAPDLECGLS